jgi:SAM-dependent MidA family methyltransferase
MSDAPSTLPLRAWVDAWDDANHTFYTHHAPEQHFRTSIDAGTATARRIAALLAPPPQHPHEHPRPAPRSSLPRCIVDIGSGSGALLTQLAALVDDEVTLIGVDVRPRPDDLPAAIGWRQVRVTRDIEDITGRDGLITGLVIAHEFLDDVACPVVELDDDLRPRIVQVEAATGTEVLGPDLADPAAEALLGGISPSEARAWLDHWWPATKPLARREVGLPRDLLWRRLTRILASGHAIAIDYAHRLDDRRSGLWDGGTVKGFVDGSACRPRPDGSVNITSHVALDSCASPHATVRSQFDVLSTSAVGSRSLASWPPDLGSFDWLIEPCTPTPATQALSETMVG